jgi:hypothetical protein
MSLLIQAAQDIVRGLGVILYQQDFHDGIQGNLNEDFARQSQHSRLQICTFRAAPAMLA